VKDPYDLTGRVALITGGAGLLGVKYAEAVAEMGGIPAGLSAGLATINFYNQHDVIAHIHSIGRRIIDGVADAANRHGLGEYITAASDFDCRPTLKFLGPDRQVSMAYRTLFLQEMAKRRVFMPWVCPSYRHGESEISQTLEALEGACAVYARAIEDGSVGNYLVGPAAKPVFRKYN
jgi:glutamate-1-semialdehyde 2,1-aminomutase